MQVNPDSVYVYAQQLHINDLRNLCTTNKYFADLCSTERFQKLIKERYEETFPIIEYKGEFYFYESARNIYLKEDPNEILVAFIDSENWKPHENGKFILTQLEHFRHPDINNMITIPDDDDYFGSVPINLDWYDLGIHYIHFYNDPNDAGETSTGLNVRKYLEYYEPEVLQRINGVINDFNQYMTVTW